jgi:ATP-dependent RNA helicase DeaD
MITNNTASTEGAPKTEAVEIKVKFNELGLSEDIQRTLDKLGFEFASPIQAKAIPVIQQGKDIIGLAQTGTGKTAAFSLPVIDKISKNGKIQLLVLAPTRELAMQTETEIFKFSKDLGLNTLSVYGGSPYQRQINILKKGVEVLVATPGRLQDLMEKRAVNLEFLKTVVLDEADEMLNMGFIADIEHILKSKPPEAQTLLFSATMPKAIQMLSGKFLKQPTVIDVVPKNITKDSITQAYFAIRSDFKVELTSRIICLENPKLTIIFTNTKAASLDVAYDLQSLGFKAEAINGDLDQKERERVMAKFRSGAVKILVATDVAARGIDVKDIDLVINYDLPFEKEYYVHRIGRTGRAGRTGNAYSFVCNGKDKGLLRNIEQYSKSVIKPQSPITVEEVYQKQLDNIATTFVEVETISKRTQDSLERLLLNHSIEQIALNLLSKTVKEPTAEIVTIQDSARAPRQTGNMVQIALDVGKDDGILPTTIVSFIKNYSDTFPKNIGDIDIFKNETLVEVPEKRAAIIVRALDGKQIRKRRVSVKEVR